MEQRNVTGSFILGINHRNQTTLVLTIRTEETNKYSSFRAIAHTPTTTNRQLGVHPAPRLRGVGGVGAGVTHIHNDDDDRAVVVGLLTVLFSGGWS